MTTRRVHAIIHTAMRTTTEPDRSPKEMLHDLVLKLYSAEEFRRQLRLGPYAEILPELPGELSSHATLVDGALAAIERRGWIDNGFFDWLVRDRPRQRQEIERIAALWTPATLATTESDSNQAGATDLGTQSSPRRALIAGATIIGTFVVYLGLHHVGGDDEEPIPVTQSPAHATARTTPNTPISEPEISSSGCKPEEHLQGSTCIPRCPAGTKFIRGTRGTPFERNGLQRDVDDYCLDTTEVTVAEFRDHASKKSLDKSQTHLCPENEESWHSLVADKKCNARRNGADNHPMTCVDWEQASTHCAQMGGRLPTEWEWEWAARGRARGSKYPWGDDLPSCQRAIFKHVGADGCGTRHTWRVGSLAAEMSDSIDGVKDLSGNVWEWTSSNPSEDGKQRVLRGGGWDDIGDLLLASAHYEADPSFRGVVVGFRCARSVP